MRLGYFSIISTAETSLLARSLDGENVPNGIKEERRSHKPSIHHQVARLNKQNEFTPSFGSLKGWKLVLWALLFWYPGASYKGLFKGHECLHPEF